VHVAVTDLDSGAPQEEDAPMRSAARYLAIICRWRRPITERRAPPITPVPKYRITAIGVGCAGGRMVDAMIEAGLQDVAFVSVNTDAAALARSRVPLRLRIGTSITGGLGAGGHPSTGERAAEQSRDALAAAVRGEDVVFVMAGMGGGTGTGAAPVVAALARQAGALTVAVVTSPFSFEGARRRRQAEDGIARLCETADTVIVLSNDRLLDACDARVTFTRAFRLADGTVHEGISAICRPITAPNLVCLDVAGLRAILGNAGQAVMSAAIAEDASAAAAAAYATLGRRMPRGIAPRSPASILLSIAAGRDLRLEDVQQAAATVRTLVGEAATLCYGVARDPGLRSTVRVTLVATGLAP
jgi:cell division protein FtsZ